MCYINTENAGCLGYKRKKKNRMFGGGGRGRVVYNIVIYSHVAPSLTAGNGGGGGTHKQDTGRRVFRCQQMLQESINADLHRARSYTPRRFDRRSCNIQYILCTWTL